MTYEESSNNVLMQPQQVQPEPESIDLPDVNNVEDLETLPKEFLSGDEKRPLLSKDALGNEYKHALRPMTYCVLLILLMEGLERLAYYGINFTQTAYLTGLYGSWSPDMGSVEASSWVQTSTAIAYSIPFLGAICADAFLGNYWTIALASIFIYLPGLLLIALSAYQPLFDEFPKTLLAVGLLGLYSVGAGFIKSSVNVMGAQQYHPILQKKQIERYYVTFYGAINVGALIGGITIPIVCQYSVFDAYMIPFACFAFGIICFLLGTPRYVRMKPQGSTILQSITACGSSMKRCPPSLENVKESNGGKYQDIFVEKVKIMARIVPIMLLIVPFNIAYGQMSTVFVLQGGVMEPVAFIDASWMNNFDALSVLISSFLIGQFLYPYLARRNMSLHMTHKFAIGTFLGALALVVAIIIDYQIHYHQEKICIMWQAFAYALIGCGEIFAISSAYEAAFTISPEGMKTFGSAINLFCIGAIPNFISAGLMNAFSGIAFYSTVTGNTDLKTLQAYQSAHVYYYLWLLFGIAVFGGLFCLLPPVRRFYDTVAEMSDTLQLKLNQERSSSFDRDFDCERGIKKSFDLEDDEFPAETEVPTVA